jgi:thioesterase domain-containing protein/acyl carrier protein
MMDLTQSPCCQSTVCHVESQLADLWAHALQLPSVGPTDNFFQLGGDSLAAAEIIVATQKQFGKIIPPSALLERPTIQEFAKLLGDFESGDPGKTVVELRHGDGSPFFCVHGVGGEVLSFAELSRLLDTEQPVVGIAGLSTESAANACPRIEDLASRYVEAVRAAQPQGPYFLGGYSFGGSVALEMAQQLYKEGQKVAFLAILDHTPAPLCHYWPLYEPSYWLEFFCNLPHWWRDDFQDLGLKKVLKKAWLHCRACIRQPFHRVEGTHSSAALKVESLFDPSLLPDSFRERLELHYLTLQRYVPRKYPGFITLFRARSRPLFRHHGWDLGWRRLAGGGLEIVAIPGNHTSILKHPHVHILARVLGQRLREAHACIESRQMSWSAHGPSPLPVPVREWAG